MQRLGPKRLPPPQGRTPVSLIFKASKPLLDHRYENAHIIAHRVGGVQLYANNRGGVRVLQQVSWAKHGSIPGADPCSEQITRMRQFIRWR